MITIQNIEKEGLEECVTIAFEGDDDLIDNYHYTTGSLNRCVSSTMNNIHGVGMQYPLRQFAVLSDGKIIGYFVYISKYEQVEEHDVALLLSFGININYRKKEVVLAWWDIVKEYLNNCFVAMVWKKNTRVKDFLLRNEMTVIREEEDSITLLYC